MGSRKAFLLMVVVAALTISESARSGRVRETTREECSPPEAKPIIKPLLKFTSILYSKVKRDNQNIIISPLSIHAALNLIVLGVGPNTETEEELLRGLQYPQGLSRTQLNSFRLAYKDIANTFSRDMMQSECYLPGDSPKIKLFYKIIAYSKKPFLDKYVKSSKEFFLASPAIVNLREKDTIQELWDSTNGWADAAGLRSNLIEFSDFNEDFTAMLLSAAVARAQWYDTFIEFYNEGIFNNFNNKNMQVNGIQLVQYDSTVNLVEFCKGKRAVFKSHREQFIEADKENDLSEDLEDLDMLAINIPLEAHLSLTILQPKNRGDGDELSRMLEFLLDSPTTLGEVLRYLDKKESQIRLSSLKIPRFRFDYHTNLTKSLKSMGILRMFDSSSSELTEMIEKKPFVLSNVNHRAMIQLDRDGAKADVIGKAFRGESYPLSGYSGYHSEIHQTEDPYAVEIKDPFMFLIRYKQVVLFVGQLAELQGNK